MTVTHFRLFLDTRPFRKFDIHLVDGRLFTVDHPEFVATSERGRVVVLTHGNEAEEAIDLLHVVSLGREIAET